ncbi:MAG: hypothetical protein Aurels2KO_24830 [Aureliella sp.]
MSSAPRLPLGSYSVQRVRNFVVKIGPAATNLKARESIESPEVVRSDSWHKACDLIEDKLVQNPEWTAEVLPEKSTKVIARFCRENLAELEYRQLELDDEDPSSVGKTVWQSVQLDSSGGPGLFENRNAREYHWDMLDGARRELPFALTGVEQLAGRNSLAGFLYSLVQQYRELLGRPA